jgi:hypothetical protein
MKARLLGKGYSYSSSQSSPGAKEDGWSKSRPGRSNPVQSQLAIVQVAAFAPGPVWAGTEKRKFLSPPGFETPNFQTCS